MSLPGDPPHLRLCMLVEDLPLPYVPSQIRRCVGCDQDVWYDPGSTVDGATEVIVCYRPDGESCFTLAMGALE